MQIYFDTATYDEIERDVKVNLYPLILLLVLYKEVILFVSGDHGVSSWSDRWHDGSSHWILHSQWHRDCLLCSQVLFLIESQEG